MDKRRLEYHKRWREKNKDSVKLSRDKFYKNNKEKVLERNRKYKQRTKKENRKHYLRLKAQERERNREKYLIRSKTKNKYGKAEICFKCNSTKKVEHHHYEPYHIDNFVNLCLKCHKELHTQK